MESKNKQIFNNSFEVVLNSKEQVQRSITEALMEYADKIQFEDSFQQEILEANTLHHQQENQKFNGQGFSEEIHPKEKFFEKFQLKYYGYEDKKSIKIKPLNMFKDLINLKRENEEKNKIIKNLERVNAQLKKEYEKCLQSNQKIETFLKDIEFTFKQDKKTRKATEIMVKAKKSLYIEAKQTKNQLKKIVKGSQANTVQELKIYNTILEKEKERLIQLIHLKKSQIVKKKDQEDFNTFHIKKYENTCLKVAELLTFEKQKIHQKNNNYRIQKMQIGNSLKCKQIQNCKKMIDNLYEQLKQMVLEEEGVRYEIDLLKHRKKDQNNEMQQKDNLKKQNMFKQVNMQRLQIQFVQKSKTLQHMEEWTKKLKDKIEYKKAQHLKIKNEKEALINNLTDQYQGYNSIYRNILYEEQITKKKAMQHNANLNNKEKSNKNTLANNNATTTFTNNEATFNNNATFTIKQSYHHFQKHKVVKYSEVSNIARQLSFQILVYQLSVDIYIDLTILQVHTIDRSFNSTTNKLNSKNNLTVHQNPQHLQKLRSLKYANSFGMFEKEHQKSGHPNHVMKSIQGMISFKQMIENLESIEYLKDRKDQINKLARYIFEDNLISNNSVENTNTNISVNGNSNSNTNVNNQEYSNQLINNKITAQSMMAISLSKLILKNLLKTQLKSIHDIQSCKVELKILINKSFDTIRLDLKLMSGKSLEFDHVNLYQVIQKYMREQYKTARITELIQLEIWLEFRIVHCFTLTCFDRICEKVIGRKLVKDKKEKEAEESKEQKIVIVIN